MAASRGRVTKANDDVGVHRRLVAVARHVTGEAEHLDLLIDRDFAILLCIPVEPRDRNPLERPYRGEMGGGDPLLLTPLVQLRHHLVTSFEDQNSASPGRSQGCVPRCIPGERRWIPGQITPLHRDLSSRRLRGQRRKAATPRDRPSPAHASHSHRAEAEQVAGQTTTAHDGVDIASAGYYPLSAWAGFGVLLGWTGLALGLAVSAT